MSVEKDDSIWALLDRLDLQTRGWVVQDHWAGDLCAIGIASARNERRLVYVSTFGKDRDKFDFECELPDGPEAEQYAVARRGEDVDFKTLVDVLSGHLDDSAS